MRVPQGPAYLEWRWRSCAFEWAMGVDGRVVQELGLGVRGELLSLSLALRHWPSPRLKRSLVLVLFVRTRAVSLHKTL